ncbi:hypothetical protein ZWY2020_037764 [Hordeum vulgare]|nr:hypothetical protein ZWY2020_037764 [Hordeum vulgare]
MALNYNSVFWDGSITYVRYSSITYGGAQEVRVSRSVYVTLDSGGECGIAYESYFPMPAAGKDKPWYSIEQGSVHFIVMSTEHPWSEKSEQVCYQHLRLPISGLANCLHADYVNSANIDAPCG